MDSDIKVYTAKEVQEILRVSPNTVLAMLKDGRLKGFKIGRDWRIPAENLQAFIRGEK